MPRTKTLSPRFRSIFRFAPAGLFLALGLVVALSTMKVSAADPEATESKKEMKKQDAEGPRSILMIAGKPSHGYGSHEHYAGLKILEPEVAIEGTEVSVVRGWPEDDSIIEKADTIVIYCDGGGRHLAIEHLDRLKEKLDQGCGLVCLHYAVETVPGDVGAKWLDFLGGHFEVHHSVNPHWVAKFEAFPDHPIASGVKPFSANDEWYFHLRFKEGNAVTPILAAVAPPETMRRKDGPHSGNPAVRKSVGAGEKQTVAWAYDRPDGGRSFGFTGGHYHWNWAHPEYRRVLSQAILWTAHADQPGQSEGGKLPYTKLLPNQDFPQPENFDEEQIREKFELAL